MFYGLVSSGLPGRCPGPAGVGAGGLQRPQTPAVTGHVIGLLNVVSSAQKFYLHVTLGRVTIFWSLALGESQFFMLM